MYKSTVLNAVNTLNKAPTFLVITLHKRKPDNETSKIHGQDNQVVTSEENRTA